MSTGKFIALAAILFASPVTWAATQTSSTSTDSLGESLLKKTSISYFGELYSSSDDGNINLAKSALFNSVTAKYNISDRINPYVNPRFEFVLDANASSFGLDILDTRIGNKFGTLVKAGNFSWGASAYAQIPLTESGVSKVEKRYIAPAWSQAANYNLGRWTFTLEHVTRPYIQFAGYSAADARMVMYMYVSPLATYQISSNLAAELRFEDNLKWKSSAEKDSFSHMVDVQPSIVWKAAEKLTVQPFFRLKADESFVVGSWLIGSVL